MKGLWNIKKSFGSIRKNPHKYKGWNIYGRDFINVLDIMITIINEIFALIKDHSLLRQLPQMKEDLNDIIERTSTKTPRIRRTFNTDKVNKLYDDLFNYGFNNSWISAVLRHQIAVFGNLLRLVGIKK